MLHALLRGENLLDTIHRNLMTRRQVEQFYDQGRWGRPVWELMPKGPSDQQAARNASETYLGRLVPLARAVWLAEDRVSLVLANGLKYAPFPTWREPAATIVIREVKGRPTRIVLRAETDKAPWRELHALTVKAASEGSDGIGGPAALQNVSDDEAFDLWVGGLVASKAKPIDTAESVFHVPAAMLGEVSQRIYESGVREAEQWSFRVKRAVSAYHRELGDSLDRPEMRKRRQQIQSKACTQFWTDVEVDVPRLLAAVSSPECLGLNVEWQKTAWGLSISRAARDAYESACPHETPRQMHAWASGLGELLATAGSPSEDEAETEAEE
jgi:CRISPR system Cascade subunit CasA